MTAIEEFKEKIQAGEIYDALSIAMSEAIELKITTWVASSETDNLDDGAKPGYRMRTRINLADGEVENEIGREFASNPAYEELQKLHLEQVQQGREIILNNLASLQKMFVMLNDTMAQVPQSGDSIEN
ncbi:MAG: hypothetical protein QNJ70_09730 [Xenococcaceae cyanobacterium MO_207.B15]|nr:hypothetical protein [Xenococcaceae cyanobacterium MO_207.B15]MDJ0744848.1 hypothetical protein [Xenococcaceae cyanobacterium MO_167.B27]